MAKHPRKQTPPRESTGAEQRYLGECRSSGRVVTVRMADGTSYRGKVRAHTPDVLSLEAAQGLVELRTEQIRLVAED